MARTSRQRIVSALILMLLAMAGSCAAPAPSSVPPKIEAKPELVEPSRLVEAHNVRRGKAGLSPLSSNPILEASAMEHARDMADHRKMSHKGSDGSSPFDRMKRQGYRFSAAAENVAYGFDDVDSVMTGWLKSHGHRRNILGNFSEIGVGHAIANDGASYWCVTFGTPSSR